MGLKKSQKSQWVCPPYFPETLDQTFNLGYLISLFNMQRHTHFCTFLAIFLLCLGGCFSLPDLSVVEQKSEGWEFG